MTKDAAFSGEREVRTFADLSHGADVLLNKARADLQGSYYTAMGALLLRAFAFEAYLNHIGEKQFSFWSEIEPIRVLNKYTVLCRHLSLTPDFSKRPYQTLSSLFRFRNAIAHGKSVVLKDSKDVSSLDDPHVHMPKADWEEYCTLANAERATEDISAVITELHKAAGLGNYPFVQGVGVASISVAYSDRE